MRALCARALGTDTHLTMSDAEVGGDFPGQLPVEGADGADLKADATNDEPATGNKAIDDKVLVGERQLDRQKPDAADSEGGGGLDVIKTEGENGARQDQGGKTDRGGITAEGGVELADGSVEKDNTYRRVRESALEAINAVRTGKYWFKKCLNSVGTSFRRRLLDPGRARVGHVCTMRPPCISESVQTKLLGLRAHDVCCYSSVGVWHLVINCRIYSELHSKSVC